MYARLTTYQCDAARLDELVATLDDIRAEIKAIEGLVDVYSVWRADGHGCTVAIYQTQAAAEAATAQVQGIWAKVADVLVSPPDPQTYENVEHLTG